MRRSWLQKWGRWGLVLLGGVGTIAALSHPLSAQVIADPSLGTTVLPFGATSLILDGTTVGGRNLFHSFDRFDVPNNSAAIFLNAPTIVNIFARVTGGTASDIQGVIGAQGTANLFLINPQGILFGPNAQLNLGGSFVATSANAIQFPGGGEFSQTSTVDPQNALLSINPSALLFNQLNPGRIESRSVAGLGIQEGSLLLVGGEVQVDGGLISVPGGRLEIAGLAEPGTIELTTTGNLLSLTVPPGVKRSNVSLANNARLQGPAASIAITAASVLVSDGSQIATFAVDDRDAGDVVINARDRVSFGSTSVTGSIGSAAFSTTLSGATGKGGSVRISTGSLELTNQSGIAAFTSGPSDAGDIVIEARDRTFLSDASGIVNIVQAGAVGKGGKVRISTGSLELVRGAQLNARTRGTGDAGDLEIDVRGHASFDASAALNSVEPGAIGNGGTIYISANSLEVTNGGQLFARTQGQGNTGDVVIAVRDRASFSGRGANGATSGAVSAVLPGAIGKGGTVSLSAGSLDVTNRAVLAAITSGQGDAGDVVIEARDRAFFSGNSGVLNVVEAGTNANSGTVRIATDLLEMRDGSQLVASTRGQGDAGDVVIEARDRAFLSDSDLFSSVESGANGKGGTIRIATDSLELTDGSQLVAGTRGEGAAGDVVIEASDRVSLSGTDPTGLFSSAITSTVEKGAKGKGGNVRVSTGSLDVADGSQLIVSTRGEGDAGNIVIEADDRVSFRGGAATGPFVSAALSVVEAGAIGQGGNINISTDSLDITGGAGITVSTNGQGNAGNIEVDARDQVAIAGTSSDGQNISGIFAASGSAGRAGDILINTPNLQLDDQGTLNARSAAVDGGNITLNVQDLLLLRRGSSISATAGEVQGAGNGGNITINTLGGFAIAIPEENSDITANAFTGRGGNVQVTAQGIFGLQFRPQLTPLSDITASSQFGSNGVVFLNTPDIDPNRGLVPLPSGFVDATNLIAQQCTGRGDPAETSAFYIIGRGGIPYRPGDLPAPQFSTGDVRAAAENESQRSSNILLSAVQSLNSQRSTPRLIEATSWTTDQNGTVVLVTPTPTNAPIHPPKCANLGVFN